MNSDEVRKFMKQKIYDYLMIKLKPSSNGLSAKKVIDYTKQLDTILFDAASNLDEYKNLDSLENRLLFHLKRLWQCPDQQVQSRMGVVPENSFKNTNSMIPNHVSGWNIEMETNKERLRLLNIEKSLGKMPSTVVDKEANTMSTIDHINDKSRSYVEVVQKNKRPREVVDLTVDDPKRLKMGEEDSTVHIPNSPIANVNSSSSSLGHLCNNDKRDNEQMLAHATKTLMWVLSKAKESLQPSDVILKLQNELKNEHQLKINAEKEVENLKLKLAIETKEKDDLQQALRFANSTIEDLKGKVVKARERKENAREEWYWKG